MRWILVAAALWGCGTDAVVAPDAAIGEDAAPDAAAPARPPAVIVMIGDGMGMQALDVASRYRHGATGRLAMEALPARGEVRTGGPSGITDSAAAATVMATGVYTYNGNVGVDRAGQPVETLVERAQARGWATGVVTTTSIPHATPASFTAHADSRAMMREIAAQQAADVMLGGGAQYFDGITPAGYVVARNLDELAAAARDPRTAKLFGAFASDHLTYVADRPAVTTEPTLLDEARAALEVLDRDPDGFFLMIEGGRIDHGGHENNVVNVVHESLAFDDTIAEVTAWARARGNVTVLVTADHECGGLDAQPAPAGTYPAVSWRWGNHTNARVAIFGEGPGTDVIDGAVVDHRWVYGISRARIDGDEFVEPAREVIPDGELGDLRHRAALQTPTTGFGPGFNQLDALWLDAAPTGLGIGVEGVFEWGENAVELWIDVDPGAGTGPAGLAGALDDTSGTIDAILEASNVSAPGVAGFGVDLVVVSLGGSDPHLEDLPSDGGLRGLRAPFGSASDLGWHPAAINFGAVRTAGDAIAPVPAQGMEVFVTWDDLYPGGMPAGARVQVAAVLVNTDGGYTSNQALPSFDDGAPNPGRTVTPLPGVVDYIVDGGGDAPPTVLR